MFDKDSVVGTLTVAGLVCIVCSILVSISVVILRPIQKMNKELDRKKNILAAAGLMNENTDIDHA